MRFAGCIASLAVAYATPAAAQTVAGQMPVQQTVIRLAMPLLVFLFPILPGAKALQPNLFLEYSGGADSAQLGSGWAVGGYSLITRGSKTVEVDGAVAGVDLASSDAFYIDGQRLVPMRQYVDNGTQSIALRKERDDGTIVIARLGAGGEPNAFDEETKSGLTTHFVPGPSIQSGGIARALDFLPSRTSDRIGNYIDWTFNQTGLAVDLAKVSYTGLAGNGASAPPFAQIEFHYAAAPRATSRFILGSELRRGVQLTSITSSLTDPSLGTAGSGQIALQLSYKEVPTGERYQLASITETGLDGTSLPAVHFAYQPVVTSWTTVPNLNLPVQLAGVARPEITYRLGALSDGPSGPVTAIFGSFLNQGRIVATAYKIDAGTWKEVKAKAPPIAFTRDKGASSGAVLIDVDGDGLSDVVQRASTAEAGTAYRQTADGWVQDGRFAPPIPLAGPTGELLETQQLDLNNDKHLDLLVVDTAGNATALLNTGSGWTVDSRWAIANYAAGQNIVADFNCDGFPDVVQVAGSSVTFRAGSAAGWGAPAVIWNGSSAPTALRAFAAGSTCPAVMVATFEQGAEKLAAFDWEQGSWVSRSIHADHAWFRTANGDVLHPRIADVDGDGRDDVLIREPINGTPTIYTDLQQPLGAAATVISWQDAGGALASPIDLHSPTESDLTIIARDLNGDGKADLVVLPSTQRTKGLSYLSSGGGWQAAFDFAPPVKLAQDNANQGWIRFVDLNGDGLLDIVYNRGGSDADHSGAWINTGSGWRAEPGWAPPHPLGNNGKIKSQAIFADVNGDGLVDLVYAYRDGNGVVLETYLNGLGGGKSGWQPVAAAWKPPAPVEDSIHGDLGGRLIDINADGLPDFVFSATDAAGNLTATTFINTGSGWVDQGSYKAPIPFVLAPAPGQSENRATGTLLIDMDGDRLPDLAGRYLDPKTNIEVAQSYRNVNGKFVPAFAAPPQRLDDAAHTTVTTYDLNADGAPDLIYFSATSAQVYLGTGAGWQRAASWDLPQQAYSNAFGFGAVRILDVTGDGFPDLVYNDFTADDAPHKGAFVNNGDGWTAASASLAPTASFVTKDGQDNGVRPVDVNGDHAIDFVQSNGTDQRVEINANPLAGTLSAVANGNGLRTMYGYDVASSANATAGKSYTQSGAGQYPIVAAVPQRPIVTMVTVEEAPGRTKSTSFRYADFTYDMRRNVALGFQSIERVEAPSGLSYRTTYSTDYASLGSVLTETVSARGAAGTVVVLSRTTNQWGKVILNGLANFRIIQSELAQQQSERRDLTDTMVGSDQKTFSYDPWINLTASTDQKADGSFVNVEHSYGTTADDQRFARLSQSKTVFGRNGTVEETRYASFQYNPSTLFLASETAFPDHPDLARTTGYKRDSRGNIIQSTVAANGTSRSSQATFDNDGRSPVSAQNAVGHQSTSDFAAATFGTAFAQPSQTTDANGLQTSVVYDGFGRITVTKRPDGAEIHYQRYAGANIPVPWLQGWNVGPTSPSACVANGTVSASWAPVTIASAESATMVLPGGHQRLDSVQLYDPAGRLVRTISMRFDGGRARMVFADAKFDVLGRLIAQSGAYFAGDAPQWSIFGYDALDRRIATVLADGSCFRISYSGNSEARIDPLGRVTRINLTGDGKPLRITQPSGRSTSFVYSASGRVTSITSPSGTRTDFQYDAAGNRSYSYDKNIGAMDYVYDGFGELTKVKRAGSAIWEEFDYDRLGRMIRSWKPDRETLWTYDNGPNAIGLLVSVKTSMLNTAEARTYQETTDYDQLSRPHHRTVTFGGSAGFSPYAGVFTTDYDAESRPFMMTYPGAVAGTAPLTIRRDYDVASGQLISVADVRTSKLLWQLTSADAKGDALADSLGNGVKEARSWNAVGDELAATVRSSAGSLSDAHYSYNAMGDLLSRQDGKNPAETFDYNADDQLAGITAGGPRQAISYDAAGRLLSKPGVGRYAYGCAGEPADGLCSVTAADGHVRQIKYDDRGNVVLTDNYKVTWTSDNKVYRIEKKIPGGVATQLYSEFDYGPAEQTVFSRERQCNDIACPVRETMHLGALDRIATVLGPNKSTIITYRAYVDAGAGAFMSIDQIDRSGSLGPDRVGPAEVVHYLHRDNLGSITLITNAKGQAIAHFRFSPWGMPTGLQPDRDAWGDSVAAWTRGFVGHDHIPQFGLINMNGRIFDPELGVFLSADPVAEDPGSSAVPDPYNYGYNNPLRDRDLNGFGLFSGISHLWHEATHAVGDFFHATGQFFDRNWKEVVVIAVVVLVAVATDGAGVGPVLSGMAAGAAGGAASAAVNHGSVGDIFLGAFTGAVLGGIGGGFASSDVWAIRVAGAGYVGGMRAEMAGGDFGRGFAIGAITAGVDAQELVKDKDAWGTAERIAIGATAGGTVSQLSGDGFANGAVTGAFRELWRDARQHTESGWRTVETAARYIGLWRDREATLVGLVAVAPVLYGYAAIAGYEHPEYSYDRGVFEFSAPFLGEGRGITIGNTIFYARTDNGHYGLEHETRHLDQWGSLGSLGFVKAWTDQVESGGYGCAPFEIQGYDQGRESCQPKR